MRKLLATILLLCAFLSVAQPSYAAITFVNSCTGRAAAGGDTFTTGQCNMAGSDLLVMCSIGFRSVMRTVSDSSTNTWNARTEYSTAGNGSVQIHYATNATSTSTQTFTTTCTGCYSSLVVMGFSGSNLSAPYDNTENGAVDDTTTVTTMQPGQITPSENNTVVAACLTFAAVSTITINSGFSTVFQENFNAGENFAAAGAYLIQTTAAAVNPTFADIATGGQLAASQAPFKAAAVSTSSAVPIFYSISR